MSQNRKDQFIQQASEKMEAESKLIFFKNAKDSFSISNYLLKTKSRESRSILAKLRLGVLPIGIDKGRSKGIVRAERVCTLCDSNRVEDEIHFLFECPTLATHRSHHLNILTRTSPILSTLNNNQKLNYLFVNEKTPQNTLCMAVDLLLKLMNVRDSLI